MKKNDFKELYKAAIVSFFIMLAIIVGVIFSLSILKEEAVETNLKIADFHTTTLTEQITQIFINLNLILDGLNTSLTSPHDIKIFESKFSDIVSNNPYVRSINLLDFTKIVIYSSNKQNIGVKLNTDDFYPKPMFDKHILRFGNPWIGKDFADAKDAALLKTINKSNSNFFPILKLIRIENKDYYIVININSDYFISKYATNFESNFATLDVMRMDGILLFSSDVDSKIGIQVEKSALIDEAMQRSKSLGIEELNQKKYFSSYRLADILPLNVSVHLDFKKTMSKWEEKSVIIIYISTLLLLFSTSLIAMLLYRYSKELEGNKELEVIKNRFSLAIEGSRDGLWDWNLQTDNLFLSERFELLLGYNKDDLPKSSDTWINLIHPDDKEHASKNAQKYFDTKGKGVYDDSFRLRMKDGSWKWVLSRAKAQFDEDGNPIRFVGFCTDITEQKEYQSKLDHTAKHDSLTHLPNRFLLSELLTHAMQSTIRHKKQLALLFIDLDGFKNINDVHGHDAGDEVLSVVSSRMKKVVRASDIVSRIGGDEFIIVATNLNEKNEIIPLLQKCLENISSEIQCKDSTITVSASIGVSFYPQTSDIGNEVLIRQADQAMYEAKTSGKNQYKIFNLEASEEIKESKNFISKVYRAIAENEFVLHYQPKVNMLNNKVVGVEALLRWNHPEKGFLYPDSFLPLIEKESELMIDLGKWVLNNAFSQLEQWHKQGCNINLNINVSAYEAQQEDFPSYIKTLFQTFPSIKPNTIEIEILETSAFSNFEVTSKILEECQKIGMSIAIDDFGTGYASLHYLKKLPMNTIKIDKSFIIDLLYTSSSLSIVEGSIGLAKAFDTNIVAEGIESEEHGKILLQFGCELAQGHAIAQAMPAHSIMAWIDTYKGYESWRNVKPINDNERSILYATIEHRGWMYAIDEFINQKSTNLPNLNDSKCYLGKWLEHSAIKKYHNNPIFIELNALHLEIHNNVEVLLLSNNKDKSKELNKLKDLNKHMLEKLKQLINIPVS